MSRNPFSRFTVLTLLATTAACTQTPAQIDLRGQNTYSRNGSTNTYSGPIAQTAPASYTTASSAPIHSFAPASNTVANASVGSIGVTDLAPPSGVSAAPAARATTTTTTTVSNAPAGPFKPATLAPAAGPATKPAPTVVNPWTNKPRETSQKTDDQSFNLRPHQTSATAPKAQLVSEVKLIPANDKAVSRLDSIISSEGGTARETPAITKPVAKSDSGSFMWPVNSKKILSAYGPKGKGQANDGINIASAGGEPVWAAADGEVVYVGNELQGYGNMVLIKHTGDKSTTYAHLGRATVDKYDRVKQGDIIGYVGNTGNVKESQLHFAVREGKDPVDPLKFLKRNVASLK